MPSSESPSAERSVISRSRAMSRPEYSRFLPPTRLGDTNPRRSYCRRVCGCNPASCAATEIANTGWSSAIWKGSISLPGQIHQTGSRIKVSRRRGIRLQCRLCLFTELLRHSDLNADQHVATAVVLAPQAFSLHSEGSSGRGASGNLQRDIAIAGGSGL